MVDREQVIKGLKVCTDGNGCRDGNFNPLCPYVTDYGCDMCQMMLDALELLETPVEPTLYEGHLYVSDMFRCGACGNTIKYHARFCEVCGRKVSWSEP